MITQSSPLAGYLARKTDIDLAVMQVLEKGWYVLGEEVAAFESEFASFCRSSWCVSVANGTDALELALRSVGVDHGSRVVTVSNTAVATVSAINRIGAEPLFADIVEEDGTMNPESLAAILRSHSSTRISAVIPVHLYGNVANMPAIVDVARASRVAVIEDCAQAHGARAFGRGVGEWGDLAAYSFYPTKNLGCLGDGGAVCGNEASLEASLRSLRQYGWKSRYVSETVGFNSRLDELQAAILRVNLRALPQGNVRRRSIARLYSSGIRNSEVALPRLDEGRVYHQYVIRCSNRDHLREWLSGEGVGTLIHYPRPIHLQPAYADRVHQVCSLSQTEKHCSEVLSLPMYPELSDSDVLRVCDAINSWVPRARP